MISACFTGLTFDQRVKQSKVCGLIYYQTKLLSKTIKIMDKAKAEAQNRFVFI
jgi:hypothetical protein